MNELMTKLLGKSWHTTLMGIVVFLSSVPDFTSALQTWAAHGHPDWRMAIFKTALAAGLALAKDSSTHSSLNGVVDASNPPSTAGITIASPPNSIQAANSDPASVRKPVPPISPVPPNVSRG